MLMMAKKMMAEGLDLMMTKSLLLQILSLLWVATFLVAVSVPL